MANPDPVGDCPARDTSRLSARARARRSAMLEAGREIFLEKGYGATSLAEVVQRSGGSLATLYALFGSKRGLFESILVEFAASVMEPLCTENVAPDPERGLRAVGVRYLELMLDPKVLAWYRMMVHEAPALPELRESFLSKSGPPVLRAVARYLKELRELGLVRVEDPRLAASQFLDLVRGDLHRRALGGDLTPATPAAIARQVESAVQLFLYGCAASGDSPAAAGEGRERSRPSRRISSEPTLRREP